MADVNNRLMLVFSIITRGKAAKYMESLNANGMRFHMQTTGIGTAPSEMMDIFGLGTNDKDIIITLAPEDAVDTNIYNMTSGIGGNFQYGGLMLCVRLSAINRLTSELITRALNKTDTTGGKKKVKNVQKNQLIVVSVNQGYIEAVMETAKKAGAMGGTVLRARLVDSGIMEQLGENAVHQERDIITIFAPTGTAMQIMEAINSEHGALSEANGIVLSVPVDKAYKI